jgi:hypothetical protein
MKTKLTKKMVSCVLAVAILFSAVAVETTANVSGYTVTTILEPTFNFVDMRFIHNEIPLMQVANQFLKRGIIDGISGEIILPVEYDEIESFRDGLSRVKKDGKYGYIDTKGDIVVPVIYDEIGWRNYVEGMMSVEKDGKWGIINTKGDIVVPVIYDDVGWGFVECLLRVRKDGKWGFVNTSGEVVVPPIYVSVRDFRDGMAAVIVEYSQTPNYGDWDAPTDEYGFGKWGFINTSGVLVIPAVYSEARYFEQGMAVVRNFDTGKWGVINKSGTLVVPTEYDDVGWTFVEGLLRVRKDGKWGFVNTSGVLVVDTIYDRVNDFRSDGTAEVFIRIGTSWWNMQRGVIDKTGNLVSPMQDYEEPDVDDVGPPDDGGWNNNKNSLGLSEFRFNEQRGIRHVSGTVIVPLGFADNFIDVGDNEGSAYFWYQKGGSWGILAITPSDVTPPTGSPNATPNCSNCNIEVSTKFCGNCGTPVPGTVVPPDPDCSACKAHVCPQVPDNCEDCENHVCSVLECENCESHVCEVDGECNHVIVDAVLGDVNGNGVIDINDALEILKRLARIPGSKAGTNIRIVE